MSLLFQKSVRYYPYRQHSSRLLTVTLLPISSVPSLYRAMTFLLAGSDPGQLYYLVC
jgi:hypothetical protein